MSFCLVTGGGSGGAYLPTDVDVILLCLDISRPESVEGITKRVSGLQYVVQSKTQRSVFSFEIESEEKDSTVVVH